MKQRIIGVLVFILLIGSTAAWAEPPVSGAIFTTNSACTQTNGNIYTLKTDIYLDGGPQHPGAAGLPDDSYYVQVTDPSGATVLGTSVGTTNEKPITVSNGEMQGCLQ